MVGAVRNYRRRVEPNERLFKQMISEVATWMWEVQGGK